MEICYSVQLLTSLDASTIKEVTKETIDKIVQYSDGSNVASIGADGASVMSGQFAGVADLLRSEYFPWLIYIHCTAQTQFDGE